MASRTAIPLVDLRAQHETIAAEIEAAMGEVISTTSFVLGPAVDAFEREFAAYCEAAEAVAMDSGISALELGMRALDIGPGDEVITPANSFIASSGAVSFTGATPIWVDVDAGTYNAAPELIEAAITPRTKAIMPVHLYGQPADMDAILAIGERHGIPVIEDACQAHGARYRGRRAGTIGRWAAFSFYPGKNLGAYGDAGAIVTNDTELAERLRMMRNYGQRKKYDHVFLAWNRRMDSLQAAVLRVKLAHLEGWNAARRQVASIYDELLPDAITRPRVLPGVEHVYHQYVIEVDDRDEVLARLGELGIGAAIHYPIPIHLQEAYRDRGIGPGSFPVTEAAAPRLLSLPMYPELGEDGARRVAEAVGQALSGGGGA